MAATKTEFPTTEGVLLLRQGDKTMAVHLTQVTAILEAVILEHDIPLAAMWNSEPSSLDHYAVEAHGKADRIYMWMGTDPFAKREIRNHVEGIEA